MYTVSPLFNDKTALANWEALYLERYIYSLAEYNWFHSPEQLLACFDTDLEYIGDDCWRMGKQIFRVYERDASCINRGAEVW